MKPKTISAFLITCDSGEMKLFSSFLDAYYFIEKHRDKKITEISIQEKRNQ